MCAEIEEDSTENMDKGILENRLHAATVIRGRTSCSCGCKEATDSRERGVKT